MTEFLENLLSELKKAGNKASPVSLFAIPAAVVSCVILLILLLFTGSASILRSPDSNIVSETKLETIYVGESKIKLKVKIAATQTTREEGLMFVESLPSDQGMLFIFDDEKPRSFWMKNTYIPLDIIFLDSTGKVINFYESAEPLNELKRYPSNAPAKYALEVNGGWGRANNLKEGDKVEFNF